MTHSDTTRPHPDGNHPSYDWTEAPRGLSGNAADPARLAAAMRHPAYPMTSAYEPGWVLQNSMGPIPLWLLEGLAPLLDLKPGQRVLDLGCGMAITSIFLAREFGVEVWAADLWIDAEQNCLRIDEAGLSDRVHPIAAEAHRLPFEHGFFDAVVSIDAYNYFGTEIRYLSYLAQFLREGGRIGVVVPGNAIDPDEPHAVPLPADLADLADATGADWFCFRSAEWWRRHWSRTLCVDVEHAEMVAGGRDDWLRQGEAVTAYNERAADFLFNADLLASEAGQSLGFARVVARRNGKPSLNFGPGDFATRIA
jgi:SAM-dependent methyltransferase